ncbi:MAG: ABC transporter ATP-binding protein [Holophagaceae bacterium]
MSTDSSKQLWWWSLLIPHKRTLTLGLIATIACSTAASFVPYWSGKAVHSLELKEWHHSRIFLIWMLGFTALAGIFRYVMRKYLIGLSREIEKEQREEIYDFLLSRPYVFYERQKIGDLMSRIGEDVSTVRMATGPGLMSFLQTASVLPVTLSLMFSTSWKLTFAVMLPFSLLAFGFYFLGRLSHQIQQKLQVAFSNLSTFSHETISGERVVQAFGLEDMRVDKFDELSRAHAALSMKQNVIYGAYGPVAMFIGALATLSLIGYGGTLYLRQALTLGDLTAFSGYLVTLAWPVMSLGWSINLFQRARAGQIRIDEVMAPVERPLDPPMKLSMILEPAALEVRDITYRFESGRGLGPLSFSLASGASLAIVGGVGSGKTILLQVLAGLRAAQKGRVFLDDVILDESSLRKHWENLGWVPQEAFLFSESLRKNLTMGYPQASPEEIHQVTQVVCLDDLIKRLPSGLDTVVGERGVILSGGERQRTALARALLRRPRLLLLDDALSAVDAETESQILANLKSYLGRTTLVLTTHRVFVAEACQQVLVLEEGKVIQHGTAEELTQVPGLYARLKKLQSLERELTHKGDSKDLRGK